MDHPPKVRRPGLWLAVIGLAAVGLAVWLFPRAMPTLALHQRLTRRVAVELADSFFRAHHLAPAGAHTAVRFKSDDALQTYVELAGGGQDTLVALLKDRDVALFTWSVRAFLPRNPHEARVDLAPDGRILGFQKVLAESDVRPELGTDSARSLAEKVLADWIGRDTTRWRLVSSSYQTRKTSGRVDRTYTFQRTGRRIGAAPIRMNVVIAGDTPVEALPYVDIPQSFERRYGQMRSANDLLAEVAQTVMLVLLILGAFVLRHYALVREVRWRPALIVGAVVGILFTAASLNELPGSWFGYDTATSPTTFLARLVLEAFLTGAGYALLVGLTVAAAETAARHAFPKHLDWWKLWKNRGTHAVAGRVAGGYVTAAIGFAYVALFYLFTRKVLGWWVPSELTDNPNLIATPLPWISGVTLSLEAGIWEECLFRALPLSLLAIWVGSRPHRMRWMVLGVIATALVFGFAHSNYTSWPPYSRGAEIFLEACLWGALFLMFGLIVTVLAHFTYDLVLFGSFAASGNALAYHVTAAIILLVLLAPALSVGWRWLRQRRLTEVPESARFAAWTPEPAQPLVRPAQPPPTPVLPRGGRHLALLVGAASLLLAVFLPSRPTLGPPFTVGRARAIAVADSVIATRGVHPAAWTRLARPITNPENGLRIFLAAKHVTSLAPKLTSRYAPPAWWDVRYVHTAGTDAERAEEWSVLLWPDGTPMSVRHVLPDSAARDSVSDAEARRIARAALAGAGFDTLALEETNLEQTARPNRRDVTLTYRDTLIALPDSAQARVSVTVAGDEALTVRRGVDLPQTFRRAQRERGNAHGVIIGICGVLFLMVLAVFGVLVVRGRAPVLSDSAPGRRTALIAVGALTLLGIAGALNSLPTTLATYDTALPWGNFLGMKVVAILLAPIGAILAYALWLAVDALRRRVGIRLLPGPSERHGRRDLLLAALGIGSLLALPSLVRLPTPGGLPAAPSTLLGRAVPALGTVLSMPMDVVMAVTSAAIVLLVVAGASRRTSMRAFAGALLLLPLIGIALAAAPEGRNAWVLAGIATLAALAILWLVLHFWARYSAWSWFVGGLVLSGFDALRRGIHAVTSPGRAAGWVTLVAVLVLVVLATLPLRRGTAASER